MAKRLDSPLRARAAQRPWIKVKNVHRQEVVIGGWMPGEGRRRERIGALLVGRAASDDGGCATPAASAPASPRPSSTACASCWRRWSARTRRSRRRAEDPARGRAFAEPELVAEVEFREWTSGGHAARAVLQGAARRQAAGAVVREDDGERRRTRGGAAAGRGARSTAASCKLVQPRQGPLSARPGFTKGDVIDYYAAIAPVAAAAPRAAAPLTLKRYPERRRGQVLLREAGAVAPAGLGAHGAVRRAARPSTTSSPTTCRRSCGWRNLADLELHTSLAPAGEHRPPDDASPSTSTPGRRRRSLDCAAGRAVAARHVRRPGPAERSPRPRGPRACRSTCRSTPDVTYAADQGLRPGRRRAAGEAAAGSSSSRA